MSAADIRRSVEAHVENKHPVFYRTLDARLALALDRDWHRAVDNMMLVTDPAYKELCEAGAIKDGKSGGGLLWELCWLLAFNRLAALHRSGIVFIPLKSGFSHHGCPTHSDLKIRVQGQGHVNSAMPDIDILGFVPHCADHAIYAFLVKTSLGDRAAMMAATAQMFQSAEHRGHSHMRPDLVKRLKFIGLTADQRDEFKRGAGNALQLYAAFVDHMLVSAEAVHDGKLRGFFKPVSPFLETIFASATPHRDPLDDLLFGYAPPPMAAEARP